MRSVLALGMLAILCASANAAAVHHPKRRHAIIVGPGQAAQSYVAPNGVHIYRDDSVPGGFRTDHDEPPAIDDASKWGGE
jgi:hypothetical protein